MLVQDYITQLDASNPAYTTQLFFTIRQVFELYCDAVPAYHRINMEKLPELSGKFT